MERETVKNFRKRLTAERPLIHSITNPISINGCANVILALGGRPIMAEHPDEAAEITKTASAVMLNIGNITDARMKSMKISAECCRKNNIPFILDIVGMACSSLRRRLVMDILDKAVPDVIKGNYSEIKALYGSYTAKGVDSENIGVADADAICTELAKRYDTVILASGKTDIVTDGDSLYHIYNGTEQLSSVTGTGCMLGAVCATFLAIEAPLISAVTSAAVMGICGELAGTRQGSGTFMTLLMDRLSTISDKEIEENLRMEKISYDV